MAFLAIKIVKVIIFYIVVFILGYYFIFDKNISKTLRYSILTSVALLVIDVVFPTFLLYFYRY
ncbi:hypothetical protein B6N13_05645 [Marinomonas sp. UCMA 3892]|jgi:hypothetical protein|uniref:Uncharacterized protein n=1 Tax=Marinomonas rhizomae TaxID=491948 RepID=A0A366JC60_9GAMM|nr:hypothetical protein [Marinomonas sp. UCMA 3892]RBP83894.1 hypothetical protein DFP80_105214 [Marinomonas rhizomae]RNF73401.1 hypothetical protein EBI01_09465 [Marinomonas rhizomae]